MSIEEPVLIISPGLSWCSFVSGERRIPVSRPLFTTRRDYLLGISVVIGLEFFWLGREPRTAGW